MMAVTRCVSDDVAFQPHGAGVHSACPALGAQRSPAEHRQITLDASQRGCVEGPLGPHSETAAPRPRRATSGCAPSGYRWKPPTHLRYAALDAAPQRNAHGSAKAHSSARKRDATVHLPLHPAPSDGGTRAAAEETAPAESATTGRQSAVRTPAAPP
ncbi:hypothetical protein ERJ75_000596000 [Trypanosoma vivax]|nr:hypothetical protein ERJ75_000596000 [Trypanosoma vivax]